uniref:Uncharacterized protein n=1 Tax=Abalone asfa-like virus TaxID=2839893 RepID=A0A5K7XWX8_9VIRU|nr:hypothetical protein [Abalone asfa-like virus]
MFLPVLLFVLVITALTITFMCCTPYLYRPVIRPTNCESTPLLHENIQLTKI